MYVFYQLQELESRKQRKSFVTAAVHNKIQVSITFLLISVKVQHLPCCQRREWAWSADDFHTFSQLANPSRKWGWLSNFLFWKSHKDWVRKASNQTHKRRLFLQPTDHLLLCSKSSDENEGEKRKNVFKTAKHCILRRVLGSNQVNTILCFNFFFRANLFNQTSQIHFSLVVSVQKKKKTLMQHCTCLISSWKRLVSQSAMMTNNALQCNAICINWQSLYTADEMLWSRLAPDGWFFFLSL